MGLSKFDPRGRSVFLALRGGGERRYHILKSRLATDYAVVGKKAGRDIVVKLDRAAKLAQELSSELTGKEVEDEFLNRHTVTCGGQSDTETSNALGFDVSLDLVMHEDDAETAAEWLQGFVAQYSGGIPLRSGSSKGAVVTDRQPWIVEASVIVREQANDDFSEILKESAEERLLPQLRAAKVSPKSEARQEAAKEQVRKLKSARPDATSPTGYRYPSGAFAPKDVEGILEALGL